MKPVPYIFEYLLTRYCFDRSVSKFLQPTAGNSCPFLVELSFRFVETLQK